MKHLLSIALFSALIFATAALAAGPDVTSIEASRMLAANRQVLLLDVRTPDEYRQARLKGSLLIPLNELERRVREIPKNRPVVVYCAVGSRSRQAAAFLRERGFKEVYNMSDGIVGWYRNGLPIDK